MRIIGGKYKGHILKFPKGLNARPTTNLAKEGLFNILQSRFVLEDISVLDLFTGTGNIAFEFCSRGASEVLSIDNQFRSIRYIKEQSKKLDLNIKPYKIDAFKFLERCSTKFDLIFADPPYHLERSKEIPEMVFSKNMLNENGLLIIEHGKEINFNNSVNFIEQRTYSSVNFSFFISKK